MGCDIHPGLFLVHDNWAEFKAIPPDGRRYEFFSVLAGVRGAERPIVEPRGLPEWYKKAPERGEWSEFIVDGDHTPSWLSLAELISYRETSAFSELDEWTRKTLSAWISLGEFYRDQDDVFGVMNDHVVFVFNFDS